MPYKDLEKQREYLRTWRRNQKRRTSLTEYVAEQLQ
jgi:hypothetical protein